MRKPRFRTVVLLTFAILVVAAVAIILVRLKAVPSRTILELHLDSDVTERLPDDPLGRMLLSRVQTVRNVVDALERAGGDDRVVGLVARIGDARLGFGHAQEIRDAVSRFRAMGKFAFAFSESFGELGPSNTPYYLATAFDRIEMQPSGTVGLTGLYFETTFLKGTLDKLGIRFRGDHRREYKNALNLFTETRYTPPHRESMEALARSLFGQLVRGVASGRKLPEEEVRALVDRGPLLGEEALRAKLVDALSYRDDVYEAAKKRAGEGARLLYLHKYLERAGRPHDSGPTIALVYGVGAIARGKGRFNPFSGGETLGAETVARALRAAIRDESVKAIVLRVDSPGGSYVASDAIWRETVRARKAGKPVVASMSNIAASGGYFVSMAADRIVAHPGTLTGSIGVLAGKPVMTGLLEKLGLSVDHVQQGAHAGMFSTSRDFSPSGWTRLQLWLDAVYADFTAKVAQGRKLPRERVLEVAKGRIWTGEDAQRLGLVDALGGLPLAIKLAKEAARIPETESVTVRLFPRPRPPPFSQLAQLLEEDEPDSSDQEGAMVALGRALGALAPLARAIELSTADLDAQVLLAPEALGR
jgi:protease-4